MFVELLNQVSLNQLVDFSHEIGDTIAVQSSATLNHHLDGCFAQICVLE